MGSRRNIVLRILGRIATIVFITLLMIGVAFLLTGEHWSETTVMSIGIAGALVDLGSIIWTSRDDINLLRLIQREHEASRKHIDKSTVRIISHQRRRAKRIEDRIEADSAVQYESVLVPLQSVLEKGKIMDPEWFGKLGPKWIDFEKGYVVERTRLIDLIESRIEESAIVLFSAKSGAGKSTAVFSLGYALLVERDWRNVLYTDLALQTELDSNDFTEFFITIAGENKGRRKRTSKTLVVLDNAHLSVKSVTNLARRADKWSDSVRVLVLARAGEEDQDPNEIFQILRRTGESNEFAESNKRWIRIICGQYDPKVHIRVVNLDTTDFHEAVEEISTRFLTSKGLQLGMNFHEFIRRLRFLSSDSLRILSFILREIDSDSELVEGAIISQEYLTGIDVCSSISEYYNEIQSDFVETCGNDAVQYSLGDLFEQVISILSFFGSMEIPIAYSVVSNLLAAVYSDIDTSEEFIVKVLEYLHDKKDLQRIMVKLSNTSEFFYSFPHRSEAHEVSKCWSKFISTTEELISENIELIKQILLEYKKKGYPSPLLKIINGCSELGVDPKSFSDFLKKEHPDIVRQAIEQEGEIAAIMMLNLPIWNIAVGQEVANAIRNMQEPWDGIGILWSVYPYAPYEEIGIENPVFDAIVDISESIFNAIRTSSSPWVIISEIRDIEPLSKGDDARSAITDAEETIIHGIQKDPNILKYVSWALFALTSDDMIESVANALPNLENPEYYLSRIVSIGKYAKNTGILASIQKSLIEIAGKIEDTSTPSWTISYLSNTLKKVSNKVIEKALTDAIPLIAKEIRESNTPSEVMKRVSWHEEISSAEEIANAVREKIESGEDVNILISQVGNIDVLASREDIKKALVHFITNTISPCKAIHTIWGNDLWALDGNLRKAASSVVSKIADQIRSIGNPSYIIILLGRAKFLFSAKEIQDAINEQAVIYRMIDICSGLQRSSRSRELCLKNDLILIGEFLTDENCKLLKEAIQSFSKNP